MTSNEEEEQHSRKRLKTIDDDNNDDDDDDNNLKMPVPNCPVCRIQVHPPSVLCISCQNTMCEKCVILWTQTKLECNQEPSCPICVNKPFVYIENRAINDFLFTMPIECINSDKGCPKKIIFNDMETHTKHDCLYANILCPCNQQGCEWNGTRFDLKKHITHCQHSKYTKVFNSMRKQVNEINNKMKSLEQREEIINKVIKKHKKEIKVWREMTKNNIQAIQSTNALLVTPSKKKVIIMKACPGSTTFSLYTNTSILKMKNIYVKILFEEENTKYLSVYLTCPEQTLTKQNNNNVQLFGYAIWYSKLTDDHQHISTEPYKFFRIEIVNFCKTTKTRLFRFEYTKDIQISERISINLAIAAF